jgi:hypothetical protein
VLLANLENYITTTVKDGGVAVQCKQLAILQCAAVRQIDKNVSTARDGSERKILPIKNIHCTSSTCVACAKTFEKDSIVSSTAFRKAKSNSQVGKSRKSDEKSI